MAKIRCFMNLQMELGKDNKEIIQALLPGRSRSEKSYEQGGRERCGKDPGDYLEQNRTDKGG